MDLKSYSRWYDYSRARDAMFAASDTAVGAVERRLHGQQEAGPAERHQPPAEPGALRAARVEGRRADRSVRHRATTVPRPCRRASSRLRSECAPCPTRDCSGRPGPLPADRADAQEVTPMTVDDTDRTTADERPGRGAFTTRTRRLFLAWGTASTAVCLASAPWPWPIRRSSTAGTTSCSSVPTVAARFTVARTPAGGDLLRLRHRGQRGRDGPRGRVCWWSGSRVGRPRTSWWPSAAPRS